MDEVKAPAVLIEEVTSLLDLHDRARTNRNYKKIAILTARKLGINPIGQINALTDSMFFLTCKAEETDETEVVKIANSFREGIEEVLI